MATRFNPELINIVACKWRRLWTLIFFTDLESPKEIKTTNGKPREEIVIIYFTIHPLF